MMWLDLTLAAFATVVGALLVISGLLRSVVLMSGALDAMGVPRREHRPGNRQGSGASP